MKETQTVRKTKRIFIPDKREMSRQTYKQLVRGNRRHSQIHTIRWKSNLRRQSDAVHD